MNKDKEINLLALFLLIGILFGILLDKWFYPVGVVLITNKFLFHVAYHFMVNVVACCLIAEAFLMIEVKRYKYIKNSLKDHRIRKDLPDYIYEEKYAGIKNSLMAFSSGIFGYLMTIFIPVYWRVLTAPIVAGLIFWFNLKVLSYIEQNTHESI